MLSGDDRKHYERCWISKKNPGVCKIISKNELFKHIYTQADQPDLIPFVASYYENNWKTIVWKIEQRHGPLLWMVYLRIKSYLILILYWTM